MYTRKEKVRALKRGIKALEKMKVIIEGINNPDLDNNYGLCHVINSVYKNDEYYLEQSILKSLVVTYRKSRKKFYDFENYIVDDKTQFLWRCLDYNKRLNWLESQLRKL